MSAAPRPAPVADEGLVGAALCRARSDATDAWLVELFDDAVGPEGHAGFALVATGGYGRGELSPHSDLDLLLLHDGGRADGRVEAVAEALWYPIWDAKVKLGHAVRSVAEALSLADGDLETATALLDCRLLAGDPGLGEVLASEARAQWRNRSRRWLAELSRSVANRHDRAGEVAFLLEPDLKEGRGGLRDVHALRWAAEAGAELSEGTLEDLAPHYEVLLAARVELHRATGRPGDVLALQEQDAVAGALGDPDADVTMRRIATAARAIAWRSDSTWRAIDASNTRRLGRRAPKPRGLGHGLVLVGDTLDVGDDADLTDPALPLRAAAAAAAHGAHLDRHGLARLVAVPRLPEPWPREARELFVELLSAGHAAIGVVEALDHARLWTRILPEWSAVHSTPQRNAYHRFTVDRHLLEAAANAAGLVERVDRPDLLVLGALLHDIGKGRPGDHTEVGMDLVPVIGARMGFGPDDIEVLVDMVRHHLLLPDVATRRDLADEGTIHHVAAAVGSRRVLALLDALTEADSLATGPAAWGEWKAGLVRQLVEQTSHVLGGGEVDDLSPDFPSARHHRLMSDGRRHVEVDGHVLTVVDVDRPGLFSRVAGVLALHGTTVVAASAWSGEGRAVASFHVTTGPRREVPWDRVVPDLERALDGRLAIRARLAARIGSHRLVTRARSAYPVATRVVVDNDTSEGATVVEVHTEDRTGVLYRITAALAELGLDIRSARVQTLGHEVVDAFYLLDPDGRKLEGADALAAVEEAVLHALDAAP